MGNRGSKDCPVVAKDGGFVHTDDGFRLINISLDANQDGQGVTAGSICFIVVLTLVILWILKKLWQKCKKCCDKRKPILPMISFERPQQQSQKQPQQQPPRNDNRVAGPAADWQAADVPRLSL